MTRHGRMYLETTIEKQAIMIQEKEKRIVELLAKVTSLENKILAHRCTLANIFRQLFSKPIKH